MASIEPLLHEASGLYMGKHGGGRAVGREGNRGTTKRTGVAKEADGKGEWEGDQGKVWGLLT